MSVSPAICRAIGTEPHTERTEFEIPVKYIQPVRDKRCSRHVAEDLHRLSAHWPQLLKADPKSIYCMKALLVFHTPSSTPTFGSCTELDQTSGVRASE